MLKKRFLNINLLNISYVAMLKATSTKNHTYVYINKVK